MATGDLSNNVRKLKTKLKTIKYMDDIDITGITEGKPSVYLPIYHYAFTQYSPALAEVILGKDIELFGKSDSRFMEAIYKILRDIFSYRPPVNKEQFFAKGFAERKAIMCTEVLQHVIAKNTALNPGAAKSSMKTSVRPSSAVETKCLPLAVPKTKRPTSSKVCPRVPASGGKPLTSPRQAPQVVNELTSEPTSLLVRHTAQPVSSKVMTRHIARSPDQADQAKPQDLPRNFARHVSIRSPNRDDEYSFAPDQGAQDFSPEQPRTNIYPETPSIRRACPQSVEVVSMPRAERSPDQSIVEIRATTSESILNSTVPTLEPDTHAQISNLYQTLETLTAQVMRCDSAVEQLRVSPGLGPDPYLQGLGDKIQAQVDNLTARMVLLENRVSLLESRVETRAGSSNCSGDHPPAPAVPIDGPSRFTHSKMHQSSFSEDLRSVTAMQKFQEALQEHSDLSLGYSPIRKIYNGLQGEMTTANEDTFALETEDDARRSSTPTGGNNGSPTLLGESSLCCNFADTETNDAVTRIKNMMKETKTILAEQNLQPEMGSAS